MGVAPRARFRTRTHSCLRDQSLILCFPRNPEMGVKVGSVGTRVRRRRVRHAPGLGDPERTSSREFATEMPNIQVPRGKEEARDQADADRWKNRVRETRRGRRILEGQTRWGWGPRARPCGQRVRSKGGEVGKSTRPRPISQKVGSRGSVGAADVSACGPLEGGTALCSGTGGGSRAQQGPQDRVVSRGHQHCQALRLPLSSPCACLCLRVCVGGGSRGHGNTSALGPSCLLRTTFTRRVEGEGMGAIPPTWPS